MTTYQKIKSVGLAIIATALVVIAWALITRLDTLANIEYNNCVNAMQKVGDVCER